LQQDLLRLQRVGCVGGVNHDGVAADVGEVLDAVLHIEFVGAAVAATNDDDVNFGDVDHGDRIVDRGMGDIDRAVGKPLALALGVLGELQIDAQAALGKKAAVDAGIERQRAGSAEHIDVQQGRFGGRCCHGEGPDPKYECGDREEGAAKLHNKPRKTERIRQLIPHWDRVLAFGRSYCHHRRRPGEPNH
jgi:hypothetical protein